MTGYWAHPTAEIEPGSVVGDGTKIWHFAHVRAGAHIGADCTIGRGVYIDTGVRIGDRCKIQNYVSVYQGCTLHDEVFLGPHVTTTNDRLPRAVGDWEITPTTFCHGASVGAHSVVVCGATIGAFAMIGAGSVVTHDVTAYTLAYGNPATHRAYICRCGRCQRVALDPSSFCLLCAVPVGGAFASEGHR